MVSKGPPVSQTTIVPELGPGGAQVPVGVEVKQPLDELQEPIPLQIVYKYPLNEQGDKIPLHVTLRKEINFDSGEAIPNKVQIELMNDGTDRLIPVGVTLRQEYDHDTGLYIPNQTQITYPKDLSGNDIPVKVDANVTSHWIWKEDVTDEGDPVIHEKKPYCDYVLKYFDMGQTTSPFGTKITNQANGFVYIRPYIWRIWGPQGESFDKYIDTTNLVVGITNLRFRVYTFTSGTYTGREFAPIGLDKVKINFFFTDTSQTGQYHDKFPGSGTAPTFSSSNLFQVEVQEPLTNNSYSFSFNNTSSTTFNWTVISHSYSTRVKSNIRGSFYDPTEYGKQLKVNDQRQCEENEIRLPHHCAWDEIGISIDFSELFATSYVQFNYCGVHQSRPRSLINAPDENLFSTPGKQYTVCYDYDVYIRTL